MARKGKTPQEKEHEKMHKIYKSGDKYHCGECGAEVNFGENCPACKAGLNWEFFMGDVKRP
jgi:rubrerythrin